jgi:hypothetical protein
MGDSGESSDVIVDTSLPQEIENRITAFQRTSYQSAFGIFGEVKFVLKLICFRSTFWA